MIDTATEVLAVAAMQDGVIAARETVHIPRGHSRLLQPAILSVLAACGWQPRNLDAIGVGIGPGSYTGVRIGVSTAKAMASALAIPLIPVSTLAALAQAACLHISLADGATVMPLLYARRNRAFGAICRVENGCCVNVVDPSVEPISTWLQHEDVDAIIDDFPTAVELPTSGCQARVMLSQVGSTFADGLALVVARSGSDALTGLSIHHLTPNYALPVQAEVQLQAKGALCRGQV